MSKGITSSNISLSFIWNFGATLFRRAINLLAIPIIARLISKDDYGNMQIIISTFLLMSVIRNSGFNDYFIKEADKNNPSFFSVFANTMYLNTFIISLLIIPSLLIAGLVYDFSNIYIYLFLIAFLLMLNTFEIIGETYFRQKVEFRNIAIASSIKIFTYPLFSIIFLLIKPDLRSLFAAFTLSITIEIISYIYFIPERYLLLPKVSKMLKGFALQFKERVFCLSVSAGMFISSFNISFPIYLIAYFFSAGDSAKYAISAQLVSMPFSLIIDSLSKVIYPVFIKQTMKERRKFYLSVLKYFPLALYPMAIWIVIYANDIVALFLGEKWMDVVPVVRIVSIPVFFNVITNPLGPVATAMGKPQFRIYWSAGSLAATFIAGIIGLRFGFLAGVTAIVLARVASLIIWQIVACKMITLSWFKIHKQLIPFIPLWVITAAVWAFFPEVSQSHSYIRMFVAGFVGIVLYGLSIVVFLKKDFLHMKELVFSVLRGKKEK